MDASLNQTTAQTGNQETDSNPTVGQQNQTEAQSSNQGSFQTQVASPSITTSKEENKIGIVGNCDSLNVRKQPTVSANVVTTLPVLTEVIVDDKASTDDFYKISTNDGVTGFCMRQYVSIKP